MINKQQSQVANEIAHILISDGMLFGDDLKDYITACCEFEFKFKNEEHYQEFENKVFECIDIHSTTYKILDIKTKDEVLCKSIEQIKNSIRSTHKTIRKCIDQGTLIRGRYKINIIKAKIYKI